LEASREHRGKRYQAEITYGILANARSRARRLKLPFDLTEEDIIVPDTCPVLGIPIFRTPGKRSANSPSLDRLNPSAGYVRGNVAVISDKANRIKTDATAQELQMVATWVVAFEETPTTSASEV
jgi:hypothetical protein